MKHRKVLHISFLALLFGLLSWLFYRHTLTMGPAFHHSWAQADRFSLALNFLYNGFDLFHPATHNLLTRDGVTGVEFPIQNYLVALVMKLVNSEAPVVFRGFNIFYSCIGLGFLYFLTLKITRSTAKAAIVVVFVFCSPIYAYYQANFLPSTHSFATALAGYYFFYSYRKKGRLSYFYLGILLLTFAAASRAPFAIFLIASLAHQVLYSRWTWQNILRNGLTYAASFGFLFGYFLYNEYLNKVYEGSMFLTRPMAFRSLQEALAITEHTLQSWGFALLSPPQWLFLALTVSVALLQLRRFSFRAAIRYEFLVHFAIATFGVLCYSVLMGRQFVDHDYYLIDSWLLPLVFLLVGALKQVPVHALWQKRLLVTTVLVFAVAFAYAGYKQHKQRYQPTPHDRTELTRQNFQGSAALLDSLKIAPDARILVIDAYSFNLPLLLMKRRGHTLLSTNEEGIATSLTWDWDYVAVQDTIYFSDVVTNYPLITELLRPVGGNGRITILERNPNPDNVIRNWGTDMEMELEESSWTNRQTVKAGNAKSGNHSSVLGPDDTYSLTFQKTAGEMGLKPGQKLIISGQVFFDDQGREAQLVVSLEQNGQTHLWKRTHLNQLTTTPGRWNKVSLLTELPQTLQPDHLLKVYLMKEGNATVYLDDLDILVLEQKE